MIVRIVIGLALTLAFVPLRGAEGQQPEIPVMNLSVVALDSSGQPVNDLTADDFEIEDAGKPRKIAFLRHIERRLAPGPALAPGQVSNRNGLNIPHATVILLDLMNQRFDTRAVASNQIVKYLQKVESADYLYLYFLTVDGRIYPVRGLPDPEHTGGAESTAWTTQIKQIMDTAMRTVLRTRPVDMDVAVRVQLTFAALEKLAAQMSMAPGRKNIVWVTDGVPITLGPVRSDTGEIVDFTPLLRQLSLALDRSEIAIYPSRQIMIGSQDAPPDAPGVPHNASDNGVLSNETLNQFAAMTGGRPDGGRDIGAAVAQAMTDARTSYQIGFYAPMENWDSKFHKLRIACKRKGVRIQAKTGYYAWPEEPGADVRQAMRAAALQPADAAEIGLRAALSPAAGNKGPQHLGVAIDARDVAMLRESDKYKFQMSLAIVGYDGAGVAHPSDIRPFDISYNAQERDKVLGQGIECTLDVPQGPDMTSLRLIAFDNNSRSIGSVTLPLKPAGKRKQER
jgi:VWFA-related protein